MLRKTDAENDVGSIACCIFFPGLEDFKCFALMSQINTYV